MLNSKHSALPSESSTRPKKKRKTEKPHAPFAPLTGRLWNPRSSSIAASDPDEPLTSEERKRLEAVLDDLKSDLVALSKRKIFGNFGDRDDMAMVAQITALYGLDDIKPSAGELALWGRWLFNIVGSGDLPALRHLAAITKEMRSKGTVRKANARSIGVKRKKASPGPEMPPQLLYSAAAARIISGALEDGFRPRRSALELAMNDQRIQHCLSPLHGETMRRTLQGFLKQKGLNRDFKGPKKGRPKGSKGRV